MCFETRLQVGVLYYTAVFTVNGLKFKHEIKSNIKRLTTVLNRNFKFTSCLATVGLQQHSYDYEHKKNL